MILKSFSKINLTLNVVKKLKNGLHDLQSYFCLINLFDQVEIKKIRGRKDIIKFKGKFTKYINKNKNSISETLIILRKQKVITNYYLIQVNKKIPVFAGLGGGTSNAACLIKYFIKKKITKNLLNILNKKLGSDLRLFLHDQGFQKNLNKIVNFKKEYKLFFLLVYPNLKSSTKFVYSKVTKYSIKSKYNFNRISSKKKFIKVLKNKSNDLQSIVEVKYPIIQKIIADIKQKKGCHFSRMTGSGSVCFGVFEREKDAKEAATKIKLKYPKFWFSVAKTI